MAHLDTLIAMIPDEKLRGEIQGQVSRLTAKTSFGLVFEEHRPETVQLPGFEVTRGGKVVFKDGSTPGIWTVLRLTNGVATIVRTGDTAERSTANVHDLVVIREFGDPIYPGLQSVGSVLRGGEKPFHSVINAENFHAAEMLLYPYEGKVDAIYLDPPYNTGAKDWKYNNDYVDSTDQYRHSKWLSFIEKRLRLAKRLLNPKNSVLIFTIDEKEYLRAGLLLEQVFQGCKIQMVSTCINPQGVARGREFSRVDEYVFFVYLGEAAVVSGTDSMLTDPSAVKNRSSTPIWFNLRRTGTAASRTDREKQFFPIFVARDGKRIVSVGDYLPLGVDKDTVSCPEDCDIVWPIRDDGAEGRWQVSAEGLRKLIREGRARVGRFNPTIGTWAINYILPVTMKRLEAGEIVSKGRDETGALILEYSDEVSGEKTPKTMWVRKSHDASRHGSGMLRSLLPKRTFPFPKSLYAVEDALRFFIASKPDALVVDFFGGSGTTAHAVMRLNRQDGGRRRSVVVTNNAVSDDEDKALRQQGHQPGDPGYEALGIFEYITMPRITAAVTGVTPLGEPVKGEYKFTDEFPMADGFEENVEFFKLTYEDNQLVRLGRRFKAIAPILWMRAGSEGERIDDLPEEGWALPKNGFYGVLTDIDQWEIFVDAVNSRGDVRCVYIVTDSQAEFEAVNAQIDQGIDSVRLYSDYLQSFEINTRQG